MSLCLFTNKCVIFHRRVHIVSLCLRSSAIVLFFMGRELNFIHNLLIYFVVIFRRISQCIWIFWFDLLFFIENCEENSFSSLICLLTFYKIEMMIRRMSIQRDRLSVCVHCVHKPSQHTHVSEIRCGKCQINKYSDEHTLKANTVFSHYRFELIPVYEANRHFQTDLEVKGFIFNWKNGKSASNSLHF